MSIKPILFNTEMVRAILNGRKTVTRRIIKPQPEMQLCYISMGSHNVGKWTYPSENTWRWWGEEWKLPSNISDEEKARLWSPPCHGDDILWVRETWARHGNPKVGRPMHYDYKADREDPRFWDNGFIAEWNSPVTMPKEAARLFLKVRDVRVERLHAITMEDIVREGVVPSCMMCSFNINENHGICCSKGIEKAAECKLENMFPDTGFRGLWDRTVPKKELGLYGWDANPFVWRIEFERCDKPEEF